MNDFRPETSKLHVPNPGPGVSAEETDRLRALRNLEILDTPPDQAFDRLTEQAISIFGVRIAAVSLLDKARQWFKSIQGMDVRETPREISFCTHTILGSDPFVVRDTYNDKRFVASPLVTGATGVRFYAGIPIRSRSGHNVGAFCIMDTLPYPSWDQIEEEMLMSLADMATSALYAYTNNLRLRNPRSLYGQNFDLISAFNPIREPLHTAACAESLHSSETLTLLPDLLCPTREIGPGVVLSPS